MTVMTMKRFLLLAAALRAGLGLYAAVETVPLGDFSSGRDNWSVNTGSEFPGAEAGIASGDGRLKLSYDFSKGGNYVGIEKEFGGELRLEQVAMTVKSDNGKFALRVVDGTGQTHLRYFSVQPKTWQEIRIEEFSSPVKRSGFHHWGGANDGVFHPPLRKIAVTVNRDDNFPLRGETEFVRITGDVKKPPAGLKIVSATDFVIRADSEAIIRFGNFDGERAYILTGYDGATAGKGVLKCAGDRGELRLALPQGYYQLAFPESRQTFGIAVLPANQPAPDDFFAVDGAFGCFGIYRDPAVLNGYLSILKQCGILHIRDRFSWKKLEHTPGGFQWNYDSGDTTRQAYAQHGIGNLDVFHDAPEWSGSSAAYPYPKNLAAAADSLTRIMRRWENSTEALEVWNEPDYKPFGGDVPGENLIALTRAVSWKLRQAGLKTAVVGGVFCGWNREDYDLHTFFESGLLQSVDVLSYHHYVEPEKMLESVSDFRRLAARYGRPSIPVWITESGVEWPAGPERPASEQDCSAARKLARKVVDAKAGGAARYYAFILGFYPEKSKNYGMFGKEHTPLRLFAVYAHLANALAGYDYLGDLTLDGNPGRVFVRGKQAVAVVYPDKSRLRIGNIPATAVTGIDGRRFETAGGGVNGSDGAVLIHAPAAAFEKLVQKDTLAARIGKIAAAPDAGKRQALPVVFQSDLCDLYPYSTKGYSITAGQKIELRFRATNLGSKSLKLRPALQLPDGCRQLDSGAETGELRLAPGETATLTRAVEFDRKLSDLSVRQITLTDENGNAAPLALSFLTRKNTPAFSLSKAQRPELPVTGENEWIDFSGKENWCGIGSDGEADIKAKFRVYWDKETLQLRVLVSDPELNQPFRGDQTWQGDSVQVAFQTLDAGKPRPDFTELTMAMTADGPQIYRHHAENPNNGARHTLQKSRLEFFRRDGMMLYVATLSADEVDLPPLRDGLKLGFSLLVNSNTGQGRSGYLHWGDGIGSAKRPQSYNILELYR